MNSFIFDNRRPLRSCWREDAFIMRKPLTDRKIAEYERQGYYSPAFRQARADLMARKKSKHQTLAKLRGEQHGNFIEREGRLIYSMA